jgi:hypothetical protein
MSTPRKKDIAGADLREGIMTGALVLQGVFDFLEKVEDGDDYITAAGKAVKTHRMRKSALAQAAKDVVKKEREGK